MNVATLIVRGEDLTRKSFKMAVDLLLVGVGSCVRQAVLVLPEVENIDEENN